MVTVGGSEAIDIAMRAMLDPGDEVLIPQPSYVSYLPCCVLANGTPVIIELKAENQFRLTPEELEAAITPKTKLLVLPFPNNPTGALYPKEVLEQIGQGMETAIEERIKSERMKVELVANVSHDIKTPLTSIISYIELLKQEENLSPEIQDYIRILEEKSERLKNMVQDVFSVSKAASGQLAVEMEEIDFGKLLRQTLADMDGEIQKSPYKFKIDIPKEAVMVYADGDRMYRVFQNLIGNALKYSLEGSRIYISLKTEKNAAVADIRNTSRSELKQDVDFTARFTRGDESRTDGGSGLGLSIAKSFTEACGGTFEVETMADLFTVKVSFEQKKCNV